VYATFKTTCLVNFSRFRFRSILMAIDFSVKWTRTRTTRSVYWVRKIWRNDKLKFSAIFQFLKNLENTYFFSNRQTYRLENNFAVPKKLSKLHKSPHATEQHSKILVPIFLLVVHRFYSMNESTNPLFLKERIQICYWLVQNYWIYFLTVSK
jgi:hypothetical protein